MRITYVKTDHGLPKPNKPNGVNVDHVKKWSIITDHLSRPSSLCSISAFTFAVILLIYLIIDYEQYLCIQPKKDPPELGKKTTQEDTTTVLCCHAFGLCLAAFGYCYAVVERTTSQRKEWLILYTTLVIHICLFIGRVTLEYLLLDYQSLLNQSHKIIT